MSNRFWSDALASSAAGKDDIDVEMDPTPDRFPLGQAFQGSSWFQGFEIKRGATK
ncbi:hypothetical protein ACQKKX_04545 [Neorhizobium sp. NPDC001467]|uniref:hypothetical protein n=1 Tax=Neorhizobium sp. NPDC001467 TaxID=3390595 RepID=UPI003D02F48F